MKARNVLWLGSPIAGRFESTLMKSYGKPYMIAQSNLEKALIKGLDYHGLKMEIWTTPSIPYNIVDTKFFKKKNKIKIADSLYSNSYPIFKNNILRYLQTILYTCYTVFKFCNKNKKDKNNIFIATNFMPVSVPTILIAKLFHIDVTCLFCDLIDDLYGNNVSFLRRKYKDFTKWINTKYDSYVFITEDMNEKVNEKNKPYVVIEGIFNNDLIYEDRKRQNCFIYSGSIIKKYGVETAISAFLKADIADYELHIYGDGEYKEEMLNEIKNYEKIKYFGLISREELFKKLLSAKFLLNLRDPNDQFTKYSFPSKLFEYFASGGCVLSSRLSGIPKEYFDYMIVCENFDIDSLASKMKEMVNYTDKKIIDLGEKARNFIIKNKGLENQALILINLFEKGAK